MINTFDFPSEHSGFCCGLYARKCSHAFQHSIDPLDGAQQHMKQDKKILVPTLYLEHKNLHLRC
jgi:hypothetical protein